MRKGSSEQWLNALYVALVVVAALSVYLLAGRKAAAPAADAAGAPTAQAETQAPEEAARFRMVPESIFCKLIAAETAFSCVPGEEPETFLLVCGERGPGGVTLAYSTSDEGYLTSLTFTFPRPMPPYSKLKTETEAAYAAKYSAFITAQDGALYTVLPACITACDLAEALPKAVLVGWYAGALTARDEEKTFHDAYAGCAFDAYPSQIDGENVVICTVAAAR